MVQNSPRKRRSPSPKRQILGKQFSPEALFFLQKEGYQSISAKDNILERVDIETWRKLAAYVKVPYNCKGIGITKWSIASMVLHQEKVEQVKKKYKPKSTNTSGVGAKSSNSTNNHVVGAKESNKSKSTSIVAGNIKSSIVAGALQSKNESSVKSPNSKAKAGYGSAWGDNSNVKSPPPKSTSPKLAHNSTNSKLPPPSPVLVKKKSLTKPTGKENPKGANSSVESQASRIPRAQVTLEIETGGSTNSSATSSFKTGSIRNSAVNTSSGKENPRSPSRGENEVTQGDKNAKKPTLPNDKGEDSKLQKTGTHLVKSKINSNISPTSRNPKKNALNPLDGFNQFNNTPNPLNASDGSSYTLKAFGNLEPSKFDLGDSVPATSGTYPVTVEEMKDFFMANIHAMTQAGKLPGCLNSANSSINLANSSIKGNVSSESEESDIGEGSYHHRGRDKTSAVKSRSSRKSLPGTKSEQENLLEDSQKKLNCELYLQNLKLQNELSSLKTQNAKRPREEAQNDSPIKEKPSPTKSFKNAAKPSQESRRKRKRAKVAHMLKTLLYSSSDEESGKDSERSDSDGEDYHFGSSSKKTSLRSSASESNISDEKLKQAFDTGDYSALPKHLRPLDNAPVYTLEQLENSEKKESVQKWTTKVQALADVNLFGRTWTSLLSGSESQQRDAEDAIKKSPKLFQQLTAFRLAIVNSLQDVGLKANIEARIASNKLSNNAQSIVNDITTRNDKLDVSSDQRSKTDFNKNHWIRTKSSLTKWFDSCVTMSEHLPQEWKSLTNEILRNKIYSNVSEKESSAILQELNQYRKFKPNSVEASEGGEFSNLNLVNSLQMIMDTECKGGSTERHAQIYACYVDEGTCADSCFFLNTPSNLKKSPNKIAKEKLRDKTRRQARAVAAKERKKGETKSAIDQAFLAGQQSNSSSSSQSPSNPAPVNPEGSYYGNHGHQKENWHCGMDLSSWGSKYCDHCADYYRSVGLWDKKLKQITSHYSSNCSWNKSQPHNSNNNNNINNNKNAGSFQKHKGNNSNNTGNASVQKENWKEKDKNGKKGGKKGKGKGKKGGGKGNNNKNNNKKGGNGG